jgi:RNase H-like domain found in reverse transcriptase
VTELLRFLGCVQFFANHIDHCADKAAPLYEVLVGTAWNKKKGKKLVFTLPDWHERWGSEQISSFAVLKDIMSAPDFLVPPRAGVRRKLVTDASKYGLRAVLLQNGEPYGCLPLGFASRKLKGAEGRWTASEKERIGVVFGLRKFRHLLYGEEFSVVTDHNALTWLMRLSDPKERLARWVIEVQMFAFSVEYLPGEREPMAVPDALSGDPMEQDLVFCGRGMEIVSAMDEAGDKVPGGLQEAQVLAAQRAQFGDLGLYIEANDAFLLVADGLLYRVMDGDDIRLVIPDSLRQQVLK